MIELRFTRHALQRLFERSITPGECEAVVTRGEVVESYPDDQPFPSELRLGTVDGKSIHVVVALEPTAEVVHVITAYEPSLEFWEDGLRARRRRR